MGLAWTRSPRSLQPDRNEETVERLRRADEERFAKSGMGIGLTSNEDNAAAANAGDAIVDAILKR